MVSRVSQEEVQRHAPRANFSAYGLNNYRLEVPAFAGWEDEAARAQRTLDSTLLVSNKTEVTPLAKAPSGTRRRVHSIFRPSQASKFWSDACGARSLRVSESRRHCRSEKLATTWECCPRLAKALSGAVCIYTRFAVTIMLARRVSACVQSGERRWSGARRRASGSRSDRWAAPVRNDHKDDHKDGADTQVRVDPGNFQSTIGSFPSLSLFRHLPRSYLLRLEGGRGILQALL